MPSLTETIASVAPERLVGATQWCTHPPHFAVRRVRGTKNPDVAAIVELRPDLVVANREENRRLDVDGSVAAGIPVWVTDIKTLAGAFSSLRRLFALALRVAVPSWFGRAEQIQALATAGVPIDAATAIWRDLWMVVGGDTFVNDLASRLGLRNVFGSSSYGRYPHTSIAEPGP